MSRAPDLVIGGRKRPYLLRWHLLHWSQGISANLHHIRRSDDDRALHDHVGWNISVVLWNGYYEWVPDFKAAQSPHELVHYMPHIRKWRPPGSIVFRRATQPHRLELKNGKHAVTLWIRGPNKRDWGFHTKTGWVFWKLFPERVDG